jgi:hypothetical protein
VFGGVTIGIVLDSLNNGSLLCIEVNTPNLSSGLCVALF